MTLSRRSLLAALSLLTCLTPSSGKAHEIKFGSLVVVHPWSRQSLSGVSPTPSCNGFATAFGGFVAHPIDRIAALT
jgi:hypothetical protein